MRIVGSPSILRALVATCVVVSVAGSESIALEAGEPIRLKWVEGDLAGMTPIMSPDGKKQIGFVEYQQRRRGDLLETVRVARFVDGSSDEDHAQARVGARLESIKGRSIIRNTKGQTVVDITIDVAGGRITGFSGLGKDRETYDEREDLPPGTYWGALIFIVVKNFDINATDGRLVFRTVAPTPAPRSVDMELLRGDRTSVRKPGGTLDVVQYSLRPTINWLIDPIVHRIVPTTTFLVHPGQPPALARYAGPRNYAGQEMRLE